MSDQPFTPKQIGEITALAGHLRDAVAANAEGMKLYVVAHSIIMFLTSFVQATNTTCADETFATIAEHFAAKAIEAAMASPAVAGSVH